MFLCNQWASRSVRHEVLQGVYRERCTYRLCWVRLFYSYYRKYLFRLCRFCPSVSLVSNCMLFSEFTSQDPSLGGIKMHTNLIGERDGKMHLCCNGRMQWSGLVRSRIWIEFDCLMAGVVYTFSGPRSCSILLTATPAWTLRLGIRICFKSSHPCFWHSFTKRDIYDWQDCITTLG